MIGDIIITSAAFAVGAVGLIAMRNIWNALPEYNRRRRELERMTTVQLHAELTRCVGTIMTCARKGDKRGMRHAHRAMRPVMRTLRRAK